jgi:hypothetical protein
MCFLSFVPPVSVDMHAAMPDREIEPNFCGLYLQIECGICKVERARFSLARRSALSVW